MSNQTEYELIGAAPDYVHGVAALASWDSNYDYPGPFALFLDLIGWSGEEYGIVSFGPRCVAPASADCGEGEVCAWGTTPREYGIALAHMIDSRLGYLEIGMLAAALTEYADRPGDVREWVDALMAAGREE